MVQVCPAAVPAGIAGYGMACHDLDKQHMLGSPDKLGRKVAEVVSGDGGVKRDSFEKRGTEA